MRMNARDMVTYVRKSLGGVPLEAISDDEMLRFLNLAYVDLASSRIMPVLESSEVITTVANQAEYGFVKDDILMLWQAIDTSSNRELYETDRRRYNRSTQGSANIKGIPVRWFVSGTSGTNTKQITLWPTPSKSGLKIEFWYQRRPPYLVLEPVPNESILYETYDHELLDRAVANGLRFLGQRSDAAAELNLTERDSFAERTVVEHDEIGWQVGNEVGFQTGFGGRRK